MTDHDSRNSSTATARPLRRSRFRPAWLCIVLGCQASVQAEASLASSPASAPEQDFDKPLEAAPVQLASNSKEFRVEQFALLGARHDLQYAGPVEARCQCLSVALQEHVEHPSLKWEKAPPRLEPTTQWVIAFSSEGLSCPTAAGGDLGASYQGYRIEGNNVIVSVEPLLQGRPMTQGAVIPKPLGNGHVYIEASGGEYGRPLSGAQARCEIAAALP